MSTALDKILRALHRVGINPALAERLERLRIGIYTGDNSARAAGRLLAEALGDTLGRLWRRLDATGPLAQVFIDAANSAAASGRQATNSRVAWDPPYDVVVSIGVPVPSRSRSG